MNSELLISLIQSEPPEFVQFRIGKTHLGSLPSTLQLVVMCCQLSFIHSQPSVLRQANTYDLNVCLDFTTFHTITIVLRLPFFLLPFIPSSVTLPIKHFCVNVCSKQLDFLSLIHFINFVFLLSFLPLYNFICPFYILYPLSGPYFS